MIKFDSIFHFFNKLPGFSRPDKYSLQFLNIAQFMGVLNDNIFKLVIAFLLIDTKGKEFASSIVSTAGIIYVIPFLLFSSAAGILADRFSKQRLMMILKSIEIVTMLLAMIAFGLKSQWASYTLLFLLSTHSAMFGPPKYAIIPELVAKEKVSSANGFITSFTYFGIIVGTFLASFTTEITNRNYILVAGVCLLIAIVGFISTLGIRKTPPQGSTKKVNLLFVKEIFSTLIFCKTQKHLLIAILGSSYFLFLGAFTQLNIIPYAITALNLSEVSGGYLFLSTAIGIALGAFLGGKVSKKRVELGLSCVAGFFVALFLVLLAIFSHSLYFVVAFLILLGFCGGLFIIPFDTFIQLFSPNEKRGQVIAANNFLSFCGVLLAAVCLYIFSVILRFSPATGFGIVGIITFALTFFILTRVSELAFPFIARRILYPFKQFKMGHFDGAESSIFVLKNGTWKKALIFSTALPNVHFILPSNKKDGFKKLFYSIHVVPIDKVLEKAKKLIDENVNPCILLESDEKLKTKARLVYVNVTFPKKDIDISFKV